MSMFKKFATAVATASLLAGLFGSAFAPSVLARGASQAPRLSNSDLVIFNTGDVSDGEINAVEDGDAYDVGIAATSLVISSYADHAGAENDGQNNENNSIGFYFADAFGDAVDVADLSAVSTGIVEVAWAYSNPGTSSTLNDCTGGFGDINDAYSLKDELTGDSAISSYDTDPEVDGPVDGYSADMGSNDGEGVFMLCIRPISETKPGVGTITVTVNGVKLPAITVTVLGNVDSVTLEANQYATIAQGNVEIANFFRVIGKDRAGQVINGGGDGYTQYLNDYASNITEAGEADGEEVLNAAGAVIDFVTDNYDFSHEQLIALNAGTCAAGDAGKTYNFAIELEDWEGDVVTSNTIPVTCAGLNSKAKITGLSVEYATGDADWATSAAGIADAKVGDGVIGVYATVVDANGKPAGLSSTIGFSTIVNSYTESLNSTLNLDDENGALAVGGKMLVAVLVPDVDLVAKYGYSITVVDADLGTVNGTTSGQALAKEFTYTVGSVDLTYSLSRVRNAARTQATWTADYGLSCSNRLIDFYWENADGTKAFTVSRKANIDGVAKFVMNRRNTSIFVMAMGCDGFLADSDFVKARFK